MVGAACHEPAAPNADPSGGAPREPNEPATPAPPPALPRPSDPSAFVGQHVLVPDGATLHLGSEAGAATVVLRLPAAVGERAPTPVQTMLVVAHEGGRLKVKPAAPELGCTSRLPSLASFDVAVWVEPAVLARVVGRAAEARFADGTSVKLRPGVVVGPPGERVEVSADGLRLAVPLDEGDVSTLFAAEPAPAVPTGLRALAPGAPLVYAGGDPVLPESALVGGGLVLGQRVDGDRTLVRVASRCAEVEAVVDPARLEKAEAAALSEDGGLPETPLSDKPRQSLYAIKGPADESIAVGSALWKVEPGKPITWPSGAAAGITTAPYSFGVEPTVEGDRRCFLVPLSEAAQAETEKLPVCLLATDVSHVDSIIASAGILGMLAAEGSSGHFLASPYGTVLGSDDTDVWGGLTGTEIEEAYGVGGLGVRGSGEGGGGTGEGTIGLGTLGSGGGGGSGLGGGAPVRASGEAKAGKVQATGLDATAAGKVVARSRNQLRFCYEKQLIAEPRLAGQLELALAVEGGAVTGATAKSDTLPDDLLRCVERSAKRWSFAGSGSLTVPVTFTAS
jgi:hypothetical protein